LTCLRDIPYLIDPMVNHTNVLGFFVGNKVVNLQNNTDAMTFVKAATRDVKIYLRKNNCRDIPVGYATGDDILIERNLADYLNCGANPTDFLGINLFSLCGDSSYI
ncbi:glycoside hydrolase family 72 protein, partial [Glonium stellatum]